jgi:hypothetical protein
VRASLVWLPAPASEPSSRHAKMLPVFTEPGWCGAKARRSKDRAEEEIYCHAIMQPTDQFLPAAWIEWMEQPIKQLLHSWGLAPAGQAVYGVLCRGPLVPPPHLSRATPTLCPAQSERGPMLFCSICSARLRGRWSLSSQLAARGNGNGRELDHVLGRLGRGLHDYGHV